MAKDELHNRGNWQTESGNIALETEQDILEILCSFFKDTNYIFHEKPKHLKNLYSNVVLSEIEKAEIYSPNIDFNKTSWGIIPDFAIENKITKKILFGEIKRQDGWVEGKEPKAGRGNAHERGCKLFTPGLIDAFRNIGNIKSEEILPFWVIFNGDITRDPKRVREIKLWFNNYESNYFMYRPQTKPDDLFLHFNNYLKKYLD